MIFTIFASSPIKILVLLENFNSDNIPQVFILNFSKMLKYVTIYLTLFPKIQPVILDTSYQSCDKRVKPSKMNQTRGMFKRN